jgi:protein O-GlcNAc transferase
MRYGLFYNMPLVNGCQNTGLFKYVFYLICPAILFGSINLNIYFDRAFSEHSLHRFKVKQNGPLQDKVRVTFLARNTKFRNVLNEAEIVKTLKNKLKKDIELKVVTYDMSTSFVDQITQTYNSDIFMAMHGAGLTHLLFLPHWATVFEVYNCDDRDCYHDLARLRGVEYFTWEDESKVYPQDEGKHPQHGTPHKKFTNYSFDVDEFLRMVKKQVEYVRRHPEFIKARDRKYPRISDEL